MRLPRLASLLILIAGSLALLGCAPGCGSTEQQLRQANDVVGAAYGTIANARDAGLIKQAQIDKYTDVRHAIDDLRHEARRNLDAGDKDAALSAIAELRQKLPLLKPLLNLIETLRHPSRPTTQPSQKAGP